MRILIYGAGAVGGHLAGRLARAGLDVALVARGAHLEAIRANGLEVRIAGGDTFRVELPAASDPGRLGRFDAVLSTLKAPALPEVAEALGALDAPVAFAVNGIPWWHEPRLPRLDPAGALARCIPPEHRFGCVIYSANEVVAPGVVENRTPRNRFHLNGLPELASAIVRAGMEAPIEEDLRPEIWRKLLLNIGVSPLAALTLQPHHVFLADPVVNQMAVDLILESGRVAAALGVAIDGNPDKMLDPAKRATGHRPSMLQDLEIGRPMEIDAIVIAVQDYARQLGVATPVLDQVAALVALRARAAGCYPDPAGR